ncbi:OmpA family protein [Bacteroides sp. UBA939]|uniref:PorE family type IX secretion system protein n=1 Tax=Bacteroides sp. UBA939 TaxID=1946092 RepID=UPI0025BA5EFB|nr:OmpA family protein [Bacteroides sp. UBA939]
MITYRQLLFILLSASLFLTSCGTGRILRQAEQSYARGEYFDAANHYKKAYTRTSPKDRQQRGLLAYKQGDCYRRINYTLKAKAAYMNAIRYRYPDTISHFYLAEMLRKNGEYAAAIPYYENYLAYARNLSSLQNLSSSQTLSSSQNSPSSQPLPSSQNSPSSQPLPSSQKPSDKKDRKDSLAHTGLISSRLAQEWKKHPTRHIVKRVPVLVSRRSDYSPMYAGTDADILYFTSTRNEAKGTDLNAITGMKSADIFYSKRNEKKQWQKPEPLASEVNSEFEEGACSFSADGKTMYFTRCRTHPEAPVYAEIYVSQRSGAEWGAPQKCAILNDTLSSVAHPAISPAGDYLYFVSDMPGGQGGLDLWRINITRDGFGYVDNLGPDINTPGDEMFPAFAPDGTLYFSSNAHPGMGGLDIFRAAFNASTRRWRVENLQSPVNSQGDDFGMTFEPGAPNRGFFSSNRGDARGWDHIFSFELPEAHHILKGLVYDKEGDVLSDALVTLAGDDGTYLKINVKKDGTFTQELKPGHRYVLLASCRGYLNDKEELATDSVHEDRRYELEFPLASITRPVLIENIFYEFNKADLTSESTVALDELIQLLNNNPNVTIELSAHCDYKGNDDYNLRLSQRRAESVVRYLIKGGIEPERLTPKGYGEQQPKTATKFTVKTAPFLKESDVLTEEFIKNLPPEQQEICNAINRRTEFRVVRLNYEL